MGLVRNEKANAQRLAAEQVKIERQLAYEKEMQEYVMNIVKLTQKRNTTTPKRGFWSNTPPVRSPLTNGTSRANNCTIAVSQTRRQG